MLKKKYMDLTIGDVFGFSFVVGAITIFAEWVIWNTNWIEKLAEKLEVLGKKVSFKE